MPNLSSFLHGGKVPTEIAANAATAADILAGKRAYANGGKLIGTAQMKPLRDQGGIILLMINPTGLTSSTYNPATNSNKPVIIKSDRITDLQGSGNWDLNTNGYTYDSTSYSLGLFYLHGPRNPSVRKHELWGVTKNAALTSTWGVRMYFNVNPTTFNDFWYTELHWTSNQFWFELYEWNGSSATNRGQVTFSTSVDEPAVWHMIAYEQGDDIVAQCFIYESDLVTDDEVGTIRYSVGSRPRAPYCGAGFGVRETPGDQWLIHGYQIMDLQAA